MANNKDSLSILILELSLVLRPLENTINSPKSFMYKLGWDIDDIPQPILDLGESAISLSTIIRDSFEEGFELENILSIKELISKTVNAIQAIESAPDAVIPQKLRDDNFKTEFPKQLIEFLLSSYLMKYHDTIASFLKAFGVLKVRYKPSQGNRPSFMQYFFDFNDLPKIFSSPEIIFKNAFGWGTLDFDFDEFGRIIENLFYSFGVVIETDYISSDLSNHIKGEFTSNLLSLNFEERILKFIFFERQRTNGDRLAAEVNLLKLPSKNGMMPGFALIPKFNGVNEFKMDLGPGITLTISSQFDIQGGIAITMRPEKGIELLSGFNNLEIPSNLSGTFNVKADFNGNEDNPTVIIGSADGSRIEYDGFGLKGGVELRNNASLELFGEFQLKQFKILIDLKNADGFLSKIIPFEKIESISDLTIGISNLRGMYFIGSGSLEISIPTHISLGPIEINNANIGIKPQPGGINIPIGLNLKSTLGPIILVTENIGIEGKIKFPPEEKFIGFDLGFKPPNGLGLSLDTGIIKGGGYLYFDTDREEYAGALELIFSNWIALKAIGLITTKMPDGSKGFSMVILITAEFSGGLQLGFGFTLLGVGGLLGLNRIVNADALREGIKNGNVNSIMFPTDVIANAPKILSDMKAFFPLHEGQFLIGPMAKIGYGTPTLISISLGVIIEFPDVNITILGVVKVGLPTEEAAVLKLNVNFMGRIEPSNNQLWFYAALYDSRILFITLEGEMGLLVNWGDNANFVFTVGGFHPKYTVPSLPFSISKRLAVNILNESFAKIRLEAYFAVTSNTVQLGARAELFFGCDAFSIDGHLGFDILFQFNPFYFSFSLSVSLGVKLFGMGLFSVGFSGLIEGPTPWHIKGHGSIGFLFFDVSIPFEHTWGETQNEILPSITILPILKSELENEANWKVKLPVRGSLLVTVNKLVENTDNALLIHSTGTLQLSQRKAPLKLILDKFGNQAPGDVNNLDFAVTAGSTALSSNVLYEKFATGEFKKLSESDKITKPGFESYKGGLEVFPANGNYNTLQAIQRNIRYETIIIDSNYKRHQNKFYNLFASLGIFNNFLHAHWIKGAVVTKSPLAQKQTEYLKPLDVAISINDIRYAIVNADDLTMVQNTPIFNSRFLAEQSLNTITGHSSSLNASYIIIPSSEILEI